MRLRANVLWRIAAACAASAIAVAVDAQPPARTPTPNDSLISPRVAADGRVTISIYAPKASEVAVTGDWQTPFAPVALQKSAEGVWSIDVGPLPADFYSYTLVVDGVRTLDPKNPVIKQGIANVDNMFVVPGEGIAFADNRAVPHGTIRQVWYRSSTLGTQRRMHVYTRRRGRGLGLEHDRPRRLRARQSACGRQSRADDRRHAERQPAAARRELRYTERFRGRAGALRARAHGRRDSVRRNDVPRAYESR